jgi:hypothetical protein
MVNDVGLPATQHGRVLLLQSPIGGKGSLVSWASHQFYPLNRYRLAHGSGYAGHQPGNLPTRQGHFRLHLADAWARACPLLRRVASDNAHIGACLRRERAPAGEPIVHAPGASKISG